MAYFKPAGPGETRNITAQVEPELRLWAEEFAARTGGTLSGIVRLALREFRASMEESR